MSEVLKHRELLTVMNARAQRLPLVRIIQTEPNTIKDALRLIGKAISHEEAELVAAYLDDQRVLEQLDFDRENTLVVARQRLSNAMANMPDSSKRCT